MKKGQVLHLEGDCPDSAFIILSGIVEISRTGPEGERSIFRLLSPPDLVGLSVIAGASHSADVSSAEDGSIAVIEGSAMMKMLSRQPAVALSMIAQLGCLISRLSDEMEDRRFLSVEQRTWKALSKTAGGPGEVRLTHEEIAQLIGASRSKVSHALAKLQHEGILDCGRGMIQIHIPYPSVP